MKNNYIGNAKIINVDELPKIADKHVLLDNLICIEVKILKFEGDYIIYQVKYCELDSLYLLDEFYCDCVNWTYAIKKNKNI